MRDVVRPLHPRSRTPEPEPDPLEAMKEMMEVFSTMSAVGDSPKTRAWELLCACARRAPIDESDLKRVLVLADKFEELWDEREKLRAMNTAEIDAVRRP